jgi:hypothetical protein
MFIPDNSIFSRMAGESLEGPMVQTMRQARGVFLKLKEEQPIASYLFDS